MSYINKISLMGGVYEPPSFMAIGDKYIDIGNISSYTAISYGWLVVNGQTPSNRGVSVTISNDKNKFYFNYTQTYPGALLSAIAPCKPNDIFNIFNSGYTSNIFYINKKSLLVGENNLSNVIMALSDRYIDIGKVSTFTAPDYGWLVVNGQTNGGGATVYIRNDKNKFFNQATQTYFPSNMTVMAPCKPGDTFTIYNPSYKSNIFHYAVGTSEDLNGSE